MAFRWTESLFGHDHIQKAQGCCGICRQWAQDYWTHDEFLGLALASFQFYEIITDELLVKKTYSDSIYIYLKYMNINFFIKNYMKFTFTCLSTIHSTVGVFEDQHYA